MKKILITGGAGLIGSATVDHFMALGAQVGVIDDLSTGRLSNIEKHLAEENFHIFVDSVENEKQTAELVAQADEVYHFAAPVGVKLIMERPVYAILGNVHSTDVVLRSCKRYRKKTFIASTSEVYGKNMDLMNDAPLKEDSYSVIGPTTTHRWAYANTKILDELLALAYRKQYGLPVVIGRFFNIVGPRQIGNYGMVIPRFFDKALKGEPIEIYGNGKQTRCFLHVSDAVRAITGLMEKEECVGQVYNIGGVEEISMTALACRINELCQNQRSIICVDYKDAYGDGFEDMLRRTPDTSKIAAAIGFKQEIGLDEILKEIYTERRGA